ncbi:MAG TPA: D-alanine--D-alanine ligase [Hellea balneolensis]|uniref:D-alanine--D-alanine ligase n=1 Tax=Hellea balneolensis TaxID=287478 RepID=A0A7C5QQQ7_9PROT|nr:D-alanine--D-alanine ligase [Hellea balneolensis]
MSETVAVLLGGISPEREVSIVSGEAVAKALVTQGYRVVKIDAGRDLYIQLRKANPDIIFNALHGVWGEDGCVQGILETFGKPYTHSGVMASALAMDKHRAKIILESVGIRVPVGKLVERELAAQKHVYKPPYVIKPNAQGSSVGVYVVGEGASRPPLDIAMNDKMGHWVLAEEFAPGRELTVAVLNGKAHCVTEILPTASFYNYEAKYAAGGSRHVVPAKIPKIAEEVCKEWAEKAHKTLGCRGLTRSDFRFDDENLKKNCTKSDIVNKMVMLELNTQPGMTPTSLAPEQAMHMGVDFGQLCRWIVEDASWPR